MHKQWVKTLVVSKTTLHRRAANKAGQKSHWSGSISNSESFSAAKMDARSSGTNSVTYTSVYLSYAISTTNSTTTDKYYFSLQGHFQITLTVNSAVTDWHDWVQELWHGGKSVTMTLTALLEEGVCKELTSWWPQGGVPLEAQFSKLVEGFWEPALLHVLQLHHVACNTVPYTRVCMMHCQSTRYHSRMPLNARYLHRGCA